LNPLQKSLLLFALNWLDAQLTLVWIRLNVATEGNGLMARVLTMGEGTFLFTKLAVGAFAAYVLYRCAHLTMARRGLKLALGVYCALMLVHLVTGFSALGWQTPEALLAYLVELPHSVISLFI